MKNFKINFNGTCEILANTEEDARTEFFDRIVNNKPLPANLYEIEKVEEQHRDGTFQVLDALIEKLCDLYGIKHTIQFLIDMGCSYSIMRELKFDHNDIMEAIRDAGNE